MSKESSIIISVMVLVLGFGVYAYNDLSQQLRTTQLYAGSCMCPTGQDAKQIIPVLEAMQKNEALSHSYAEYLLEGLVRDRGLPLERARNAFTRDFPGGLSDGWRWLGQWETGTGPVPLPVDANKKARK